MVTSPPMDAGWRTSAWSPPPDLTIDEWAEQTVVLPRAVSAEPGPISLDRTPYLREILRLVTDPEVEEITLCFSTQLGKTLTSILIPLYFLDQDPWPCLIVSPREDDAISLNTDRLQKIIQESPQLARHLTGAANDMTREAIRLNGASIHFVGANSPAALASRAICILILDETDKYPPFSGREADPIALAMERTRTFLFRKILKDSTPTTEQGYIWQEYRASDRRRYWVPCPHCGAHQVLTFGSRAPGAPGIHWPVEERDPERVIERTLAWYECVACHGRIDDAHKPAMLRAGVWAPEAQKVGPGGELLGDAPPRRRVGYHLSALYSPWLTWSQIAAQFLRSKDALNLLMNFRNSWLAELWEEKVEEVKGEHIRSRMADYEACQIPVEAHVLTAGVDVQADHLWYVIRAWGAYGESWLIRAGQVPTWESLHAVLFLAQYPVIGRSERIPLAMVCIDAGFRHDEVYNYCRSTGSQAIRGDSRPQRTFRVTKHQHADGSTSPLVMIDTDYYKAKIHRLIRIKQGDPGAWHVHRGTAEEYVVHMTSEQRVRVKDKRTGRFYYRWKTITEGAPNHLFDCEIYALAGAEILDVEHRFVRPPAWAPAEEGAPVAQVPAPPVPLRLGKPVQRQKRKPVRRLTAGFFRR